MHGQPNIKICNAKQAKQIFQYKKIKIKLHKNNAAIWYKTRNLCIKLVIIKKLYYDARPTKYQDLQC